MGLKANKRNLGAVNWTGGGMTGREQSRAYISDRAYLIFWVSFGEKFLRTFISDILGVTVIL